ncbi:putative kinesin [Trypanosoma grayi]|uniref:putative kinesin n=1 Tax=Trypanosoma grayi TaxID=71804 RepID=UPI0004F438C5|nr:putative kinesin [Trypanosoma grayi]KEG13186.1 putative kinesin [Trypanosoma grayi]
MSIGGSVKAAEAPANEDDSSVVEAPKEKEQNSVKVIVRVRPLSTIERADPSVKNVVQCLKDSILVQGVVPQTPFRYFGAPHAQPRPQHFTVDKVFHPHSTQLEVYAACQNIVSGTFEGINGSILAYGATGSGKTHTMFGGSMSVAGVIYQAVQDILEEKERLEEEGMKTVTLRCSFLEVYNEVVFDLLAPASTRSGRRTSLKVQNFGQDDVVDPAGCGVNPESLTVKGLTYVTPDTAEDFTKYVERGHANRVVAATTANAHSSRSHAILTLEVEVKDTVDASQGTIGRIRFCDLAGSERAAGTSNSGIRLREGGNINRSLLALGAVVQALAQRKKYPKKVNYIPYRGSKLTRLLQDGLGGNCRTLILFCVSPSNLQYEETINTMLFAMQAKEIQVAAKRHEYRVDSKEVAKSQETLIEELRTELALARDELLRLKMGGLGASVGRPLFSRQASQVPAEVPSAAQLSSSGKGELIPVLTAFSCSVEREGLQVSPDVSPTLLHQSHRASTRMPVMSEGSEAYTELQNKLKKFSVAKEALYREMRDAQEANSELDIRLRQHKWKLARFLSSRKRSNSRGADAEKVTPVGVAGLRHTIKQMEIESAAHGDEMERILTKMNETDRIIANIRQELLREKQHPLLELLLDNVKLRQSCTEADCLAAHYHQECRSIMNREEEYAQALSVCVSAIRRMIPYVSTAPSCREEAQLALVFANLPALSTPDIIPVFERAMKTGSAPVSSFIDSQPLLSSVESMEARFQRILGDRKTRKNGVARQHPVPQPLPPPTLAPPPMPRKQLPQRRKDPHAKVAPVISSKFEKAIATKTRNTTRSVPEPFARSYTTTTLRKPVPNGAVSGKKVLDSHPMPNSNSNGKKSVSFVPPTKKTNGIVASKPFSNGVTRGVKGAVTAAPSFGRSHTTSEIVHSPKCRNGSSTPSRRGDSNERLRMLCRASLPKSGRPMQNGNSDGVRPRHNRIAFLSDNDINTAGVPQKPLYNADLVERYDKLLNEIRQWHHEGAAAVAARGKPQPRAAAAPHVKDMDG